MRQLARDVQTASRKERLGLLTTDTIDREVLQESDRLQPEPSTAPEL